MLIVIVNILIERSAKNFEKTAIMAISSTSSCSPSPATSTSSRTMSSSSPSASSCHAGTCNMVPGTSSTASVPVITSFAMKGDSVSPGKTMSFRNFLDKIFVKHISKDYVLRF